MRINRRLAFLLLLPGLAQQTYAIDCSRARTPTEMAICSNMELRAYDSFLEEAYVRLRETVPMALFAQERQSQREWIQARDKTCQADAPCLILETQRRTAALNSFVQSYTERLRNQLAPRPLEPVVTAPSTHSLQSLSPAAIYERAAQSVVVVLAFDAKARTVSQGSGVVLAQNVVATNCHVLAGSKVGVVLFRGLPHKAALTAGSVDLDFCILVAADLPARAAESAGLSTVVPGQRVYSVGSPVGLELTIAEGLVSGLRPQDGYPLPLIQTSAPISLGSSGGGLFDEFGRVIGLTTFLLKDTQNINFALPIELSSRVGR